MKIQLTNDADKLIAIIYKEFLSRRKNKVSKFHATVFSIEYLLTLDKLSSWLREDVEDTLAELHEIGLIEMDLGYDFNLTDKGIYYLENCFKNGIIDVIEFITKFIP